MFTCAHPVHSHTCTHTHTHTHTHRILFYLFQACSTLQCYSLDILSTSGGLNLVTTAILYLAGVTVLLIFVSIYLSFVLPGEYGVRKSPLFPILGELLCTGVVMLLVCVGMEVCVCIYVCMYNVCVGVDVCTCIYVCVCTMCVFCVWLCFGFGCVCEYLW